MAIVIASRPMTDAPADGVLYYQCLMRNGELMTVGWIEERGAREGALVELKGEDGLWSVIEVYEPPRDLTWLREKQRKDRNSLHSIKGQ